VVPSAAGESLYAKVEFTTTGDAESDAMAPPLSSVESEEFSRKREEEMTGAEPAAMKMAPP